MGSINVNKFRKSFCGNTHTAFEFHRDQTSELEDLGKEIIWKVAPETEFREQRFGNLENRTADEKSLLDNLVEFIRNSYLPPANSTFKFIRTNGDLKIEFTGTDVGIDNPLSKLTLVPISEWAYVSEPLEINFVHNNIDVGLNLQLTSSIVKDWRGFYMHSIADFSIVSLSIENDYDGILENSYQLLWGCNNKS